MRGLVRIGFSTQSQLKSISGRRRFIYKDSRITCVVMANWWQELRVILDLFTIGDEDADVGGEDEDGDECSKKEEERDCQCRLEGRALYHDLTTQFAIIGRVAC
jgi:hypothetical protein